MDGRDDETTQLGAAVSAPPRPAGSLPTPALLIFLTVAALVLAGGVVAVRFGGAGAVADALPGQLRYTYPTVPKADWTSKAADIIAGRQFVRPDPVSHTYSVPGFIDLGDILVSTLATTGGAAAPILVAVDAATGAPRWQSEIGDATDRPSCATRTVRGLLPCLAGDSVHFVRVADGRVDHRLPTFGRASRVEVSGEHVIVAGYLEMSWGTTDDLTARWHERYPEDTGNCIGSGDSQQFGVTDRIVYFGSDVGAVVADAITGRRVVDDELQAIAVYPGQGLVGVRCTDYDSGETVVLDESGRELRTHPGQRRPATPSLIAPGDEGPYIIGGTAYRFSNGEEQWTTAADTASVVGDLVLTSTSGTTTGYDRRTGRSLWSTATKSAPLTSDGQRLFFSTDAGLAAVEMTTGSTAWTQPSVTRGIEPAGTGFVEPSGDSIVFYPPTGGIAHPPTLDTSVASTVDPAGSSVVTRCGRVPAMRPIEYRTETGALIVKMELRAACSDGDVLSTSGLRITVTSGGKIVASGLFDFGDAPMYLPRTGGSGGTDTVVREFRYPLGSFWQVPTGSGAEEFVECEDQGTSRGPDSGAAPTSSAGGAALTAVRAVLPVGRDSDTVSLEALRARADADRPYVTADLADRWVPQISAKRVNLVAPDVNGQMVTWTATDILNQHLRMRLQYPNVRLVWSDEWRSFDLAGWWVTLAGVTSSGPDTANQWCDGNGIPVDECFAKVVSNSRDSTGTTRYRR